jgi:hypothetical protein
MKKKNHYYEFILSANVYLPKYIESKLGSKYFENNDNNNARAKKTNVIWCEKKKGTNWGIKYIIICISLIIMTFKVKPLI